MPLNLLSCVLALTVLIGPSLAAPPQHTTPQTERTELNQLLHDGYAALQSKDWQAAIDFSRKAIALDAKNQNAWAYLARGYEMLGEFPKVEHAARMLIAINPAQRNAYNTLGWALQRQGRLDEAMASYLKQVEVNPQNPYAPTNLSHIFASRRQWDQARHWAEIAAVIPTEMAARWYFLGKTQLKTGLPGEARQSFDHALTLPHNPMVENDIAYDLADAGFDLDRSWTLISAAMQKSLDPLCDPKALADADLCTSQFRQLAYMLDTAGWILYRQGKTESAEPYLRSAFAITPHPESRVHLATLLAKTSRVDEAVHTYVEARTLQGFELIDPAETLREMARAAGGQASLDAFQEPAPGVELQIPAAAKAIAFVDGSGKVLDARAVAPAPAAVADAARSLALPAIAWPGMALHSIRTIEFERAADGWLPSRSYVGTTPPPPPCGSAPRQTPVLITENTLPAMSARGCPGI